MNIERGEIRLPLINNYVRIIKSLAVRGRHAYQEYFIKPLAAWSDWVPKDDIEKLIRLLKHETRRHDSKDLAMFFKKAIIKSVTATKEDLSLPGNLALDFLNEMRRRYEVASSGEAHEFMEILHKPFSVFSDHEFKRMNKRFQEEVALSDPLEIRELMAAQTVSEEVATKEEEHSRRLIGLITEGLDSKDLAQLKKEVVSYLFTIATPRIPDLHSDIDPLITKIELEHPGFNKEVMDAAAILIYHEIIKAIRDNKLKDAVLLIARHTVLFRGNPETLNAREVGSFEKILFDLIEKKKLWDKI